MRRLTLESLQQGFNVFKLKVGADLEDDLRRARLVRSIIDDPANMPKDRKPIDPASIEGKNAGPTGCVLMVDANRTSPTYVCSKRLVLTRGRGLGCPSSYRIHEAFQRPQRLVHRGEPSSGSNRIGGKVQRLIVM